MEILNQPGFYLMEALSLVGLKTVEALNGWDLKTMKSSKKQDPQQFVKIFVNALSVPAHYSLALMQLQTASVF